MKIPALAAALTLSSALISSVQATTGPGVWMLATISNQGTTRTRTLFFYHPSVSSLSDCKEEIQRGRMNQWRYYYPPSSRSFSVGESLNFRCVYSDGTPEKWMKSLPYQLTYRLRIDDNRLYLQSENTYADCMSAIRADPAYSCTSSNQTVKF